MFDMSQERKRLEVLLEKKVLTAEEMEELKENLFVDECEFVGMSSDHYGCYWYDVKVIQEGYLPSDNDYHTDKYDIYEEKEKED